MNTCDTCKWWRKRACKNPKLNDDKEVKDENAFPMAHDEDAAIFCTGPKFGCIHHEQAALIPNPAYETATHELLPCGTLIERRLA